VTFLAIMSSQTNLIVDWRFNRKSAIKNRKFVYDTFST
jgi:hypothetical protein